MFKMYLLASAKLELTREDSIFLSSLICCIFVSCNVIVQLDLAHSAVQDCKKE